MMENTNHTWVPLKDSRVEAYVTDELCILEDGACNSIVLEGDDAKRFIEHVLGGLTEDGERDDS